MKKLLLIGMLFGVQSSFSTESVHYGSVKNLSVSYKSVSNCGAWRAGDLTGYWRVIVTDAYRGVGSELYFQSIIDATQVEDARIFNTLAIKELNDDHAQYTVESLRCKVVRGQASVEVEASYEHDENDQMHKFVISPLGNNAYKLKRVKKFR